MISAETSKQITGELKQIFGEQTVVNTYDLAANGSCKEVFVNVASIDGPRAGLLADLDADVSAQLTIKTFGNQVKVGFN